MTPKMKNLIVDFVIAGQPKSGTTALAQFLSEHPQICISYPKEPHYFATDTIAESDKFYGKPMYFLLRKPKDLKKLFAHRGKGQLLGDASTGYLYSKVAAKNIREHNPEAKIIILLRNPVDFIHSLHTQYVNEAVENETDFSKALALEKDRKKGKSIPPKTRCPSYHFYLERIKYHEQVKRYYDVFPEDQILVLIAEEFRHDNQKYYQEVLRFLGVDSDFMPNFGTVHESKVPRLPLLNQLVHTLWFKKALYITLRPRLYTKIHKKINKLLLKKQHRSKMDGELRAELEKKAKPEIEKISKFLDKDLASIWSYEK